MPDKAIADSYAILTSRLIAGRSTAAVKANAALSETPICKPCAGHTQVAALASAASSETGTCKPNAGQAQAVPADQAAVLPANADLFATWINKPTAVQPPVAVKASAVSFGTTICKPCVGRIPAADKANAVLSETGICRLNAEQERDEKSLAGGADLLDVKNIVIAHAPFRHLHLQ